MAVVLYPRLAAADRLQVWVGADAVQTPQLTWTINGSAPPSAPRVVRAIASARPANVTNAGEMRVFTGLYELDAQPATTYRVGVATNVGSATRVMRTPPATVPQFPNVLRMLLVSCYHNLEDNVGASAVIGQLVKTEPPDITVFAGDQVYLDLPTLRDFEDDTAWLARKFEREDYRPNWFGVQGLGLGGLSNALAAGPGVFTPDDHEYWDNYPQLAPVVGNTWTANGRSRWRDAARPLWNAFQQAGDHALGDAIRHDVEPIAMLVMDSRSDRQEDRSRAFKPASLQALRQWRDDVIARHWLGILVTGQTIFLSQGGLGEMLDWNLSSHGDYAVIVRTLRDIVEAGRSVLCLTGDTHWGRVLWGKHNARPYAIGEILSSPAALVTNVANDSAGRWWRRLTGTEDPVWPRHPDPVDDADAHYPTAAFGSAFEFHREHGQKGDHVVTLRFGRIAPQTLQLTVTFTPIHRTQPSVTRGPFLLRL